MVVTILYFDGTHRIFETAGQASEFLTHDMGPALADN
jgi:hypothetical protein